MAKKRYRVKISNRDVETLKERMVDNIRFLYIEGHGEIGNVDEDSNRQVRAFKKRFYMPIRAMRDLLLRIAKKQHPEDISPIPARDHVVPSSCYMRLGNADMSTLFSALQMSDKKKFVLEVCSQDDDAIEENFRVSLRPDVERHEALLSKMFCEFKGFEERPGNTLLYGYPRSDNNYYSETLPREKMSYAIVKRLKNIVGRDILKSSYVVRLNRKEYGMIPTDFDLGQLLNVTTYTDPKSGRERYKLHLDTSDERKAEVSASALSELFCKNKGFVEGDDYVLNALWRSPEIDKQFTAMMSNCFVKPKFISGKGIVYEVSLSKVGFEYIVDTFGINIRPVGKGKGKRSVVESGWHNLAPMSHSVNKTDVGGRSGDAEAQSLGDRVGKHDESNTIVSSSNTDGHNGSVAEQKNARMMAAQSFMGSDVLQCATQHPLISHGGEKCVSAPGLIALGAGCVLLGVAAEKLFSWCRGRSECADRPVFPDTACSAGVKLSHDPNTTSAGAGCKKSSSCSEPSNLLGDTSAIPCGTVQVTAQHI